MQRDELTSHFRLGQRTLLTLSHARRFHVTSATGAVRDPITDKLFATSVMVSLLVWGKLRCKAHGQA